MNLPSSSVPSRRGGFDDLFSSASSSPFSAARAFDSLPSAANRLYIRWTRSARKTLQRLRGEAGRAHGAGLGRRGLAGGVLALLLAVASRLLRRAKLDLQPRRVLSVPHLLVLGWALFLLWGERWIFESRVRSCDWDHWEDWPSGATPHHLIFVADPQLIDPHTYPGRPWPLDSLTYTITDNYLRRSYSSLENRLRPDSIYFLGDLFDGGREWKTARGDFADPPRGWPRPAAESAQLSSWRSKYTNEFWMREYARFIDIFVRGWNGMAGSAAGTAAGGTAAGSAAAAATPAPGPWQRGRRLVASLPGNHDLGFGSQVKLSVRDRFSAFFGELNRVDVVGNHTIVSIDALSLSAGTSDVAERAEMRPIHEPTREFLRDVRRLKHRAVERELHYWHGRPDSAKFAHAVQDTDAVDFDGESGAVGPHIVDLPTILLSHVPLSRPPGTPCGPMREHWPPSRDGDGGAPDHANAISLTAGYQYQNVLSEADSDLVVRSVGNVVHAFSGDDHDYCEIVHRGGDRGGLREITVKSISMAMGVPTPGFLMVSLFNPVDPNGAPLRAEGRPTLQTHLCLLPNQFTTYTRYVALGVVTVVMLALRALLVPTLHLTPFALDAADHALDAADHALLSSRRASRLPLYEEHRSVGEKLSAPSPVFSSSSSSAHPSSSASYSDRQPPGISRARSGSVLAAVPPAASSAPAGTLERTPSNASNSSRKSGGGGSKYHKVGAGSARWGWGNGAARRQVRINFNGNDFDAMYDGGKSRVWRAALWRTNSSRGRSGLRVAARELWASVWRVGWMAGLFWVYLTWKG